MDVYWLEQSQGDLPSENDWLSASEAVRLHAMPIAKRRADWRLGRWTAKQALAAHMKVGTDRQTLAQIEVRASSAGAPHPFFSGGPIPACISLSHREGVAICAIGPSGTMIGCDLEAIEPRSELFLNDYFAAEEQALLTRAPSAERFRIAASLWSAKESALKALRTGLRLDTRSVVANLDLDAAPTHDGWRPLLVRYAGEREFHGWWLQQGELVISMVAAPRSAPPIRLEEACSHHA